MVDVDDLKIHIFKLKKHAIENKMLLFEKQKQMRKLKYEENQEEIHQLKDLYESNVKILERIENEIKKTEDLYNCLRGICFDITNEDIYDLNYWNFIQYIFPRKNSHA